MMTPQQVTALLTEAQDRAYAVKSADQNPGTDKRLLEILRVLLEAARANGRPKDRLANLQAAYMQALTQWPQMLGRELYARVFTRACCPTTSIALAPAA